MILCIELTVLNLAHFRIGIGYQKSLKIIVLAQKYPTFLVFYYNTRGHLKARLLWALVL